MHGNKGKMPKNFNEIQKLGWASNKGRKASLSTREKMSTAHKGQNLGKKLSTEHRLKLSEARKEFYKNGGVHPKGALGNVPWNKGNCSPMSDETYAKRLFNNRLRKARRKGAKGSHTLVEWNDLKRSYNFMCLCCKQQEPSVKLTEDHVIPIIMGGSNDISNIQPLCQSCNSLKWTKITDYRPQPTAMYG